MSRTSLDAPAPASSPEDAAGAGSGAAGAAAHDPPADDGDHRFGEHPATRLAADVEYRGRAGEHDYVVRVRHRLLDTSFTVQIDGIEHDPKAEEKARKEAGESEDAAVEDERGAAVVPHDDEPGAGPGADDAERARDAERADDAAGADHAEESEESEGAEGAMGAGDPEDPVGARGDLQFSLEDGFATLHCTVRRRREGGEIKDCEVITIRTAGLGGAGEVEIRHGFRTTVLIPAEGSPSALRDERRTAHPTRYALVAALTKGAKFLIPLLGLGALFSGLLDPVKQWVEERIRPAVDAIVQATQPIRDWIEEVTRPVREFFDALLSPVRELIAAILRPIGEALRWLLGLLPDIGLPFDVPGWLVDVLVPVLVVVAVFAATYSGLRKRREKLAETEAESARGASTRVNAGEDGTDGASTATAERAEVAVEDEASERDDQAAKGTSSTPEEPAAQDGSSDRGDTGRGA